ncbi:IclR family transcriptional regulator [Cupriavidus phytorum]|uniref:IclR family transcriptional regulator n=2 Tax=Cupriavidus TaxID=106589 RepID=A0A975XIU0_9BURK|nr:MULTISPECIES: IclR family transcriptional regulator [Cupriavidus]PZX34280.1 IclR family transcriptional regulator [Cupriavidus alkaliphilus]SOY71802.1 IclR family transcriptional regulator [Cupriavidus taiwanensis]
MCRILSAPASHVTKNTLKPGRPALRANEGAGVTGSLARGLQVLDVLRQANGYVSLSDIAAETGLDASTAHRLLQTLVEHGYAVREEVQKRYLPGPLALSPLSLFHPITQLRRESAPTLHSCQKSVGGATVALVLFIGSERLIVDFVQGTNPLSPYYDTWLKSPLHGSASGKLLLAWMTGDERERLLGPGPYEAHTSKTITEQAALMQELNLVRMQGYAVARDDYYDGLMAVGAPLIHQNELQPLGALLVTAPSDAVASEDEEAIGAQLKAASKLLMNAAPSLQILKQWTGRGAARRHLANTSFA